MIRILFLKHANVVNVLARQARNILRYFRLSPPDGDTVYASLRYYLFGIGISKVAFCIQEINNYGVFSIRSLSFNVDMI